MALPSTLIDIDLVYLRSPENIECLHRILYGLNPVVRPNASHLSGGGHLNLITDNGPLDLLASIGQGLGYEDLLSNSVELEIGLGLRTLVLDLETIIALKEQLAGDKDLAMLPVLRQTLKESKSSIPAVKPSR